MWRQLLLGTLIALIAFFGLTQAQYSSTTCIKDPQYILLAEAATKNTSVNRYYYICSNTVLNTKPFSWGNQTFTTGTGLVRPLIFIYPNAHIICGPDGKVSNNCTMRGGTYHLEVTDAGFFSLPTLKITNVSVEGVTFSGLGSQKESANIYIFGTAAGADLLVKNCVFQDNTVVSNIKFEDNYFSSVTVDGSVFKNNKIIDSSVSRNSGLIFSDLGGAIKVTNSLFTDNIVNTTYPLDWYGLNAIINAFDYSGNSSITSKVDVQNSCFVKNTGVSFSLVLGGVYGDGTMTQTGNTAYQNTFLQSGTKACSGIGELYMDPNYYYGGYYNFTLGKCLQTFSSSQCKLSSVSSFTSSTGHVSVSIKVAGASLFLALVTIL